MRSTDTRVAFCFSLSFAVALLLAPTAGAVPLTEWGTDTVTSAADCPSFCTNFTFGPSTGGENETSSQSDVNTFQGNAQASADLDPGAGLNVPILKGEAYSTQSGQGSAFSTAFAVEGYTYTGPGSKDFTLDILLTGSVSDPTPGDNDTFIRAQIYIFEPEPFAFIPDISTLVFEVGAVEIDSTVLTIAGNETNAVRQGSVSFTLATGESVYLWALLDAEAQRELGFADAFSTLALEFEDGGGLVAASVPEPTTAALLALGVLGLAWRRQPAG